MTTKPKKCFRYIEMIILFATILSLGMTWSTAPIYSTPSPTTRTSAPVIDDISCDSMEHLNMHIHSHLDIFINGSSYPVPSDVGRIPDQCIYWMHTHDDKGVIHIESPEDRNFTLGEFFDIWGQNFSNSQIFDNRVEESDNGTLNVYVNGKKVSAGDDYTQIPIKAHHEIAIVYGTPPDSIPSTYAFPEGL
jgi:hypothetical protein